MTKEEYNGVEEVQITLSRLASLLSLISQSTDDGDLVDAIDLCASHANLTARAIDRIPGYLEAQCLNGRAS